MLEVILKQEVRRLGDRGEVVRVANGYARNFLFPRNLAMPATTANKKQIEEMQAAATREAAYKRGEAEKAAELMGDVSIRIVEKAGESGQLFGSVTARDVADKLAAVGHPIDRHKIILERPIKEIGDYDVRVHLYRDVKVTVKVEVRAEGREDEPLVAPEEKSVEAEAEAAAATAPAEEAPAEDADIAEEMEQIEEIEEAKE